MRYDTFIQSLSLVGDVRKRAKKKLLEGGQLYGESMYDKSPDELKSELLDEFADIIGWCSPFYEMVDNAYELPSDGPDSDAYHTSAELRQDRSWAEGSLLLALDNVDEAYYQLMEAIDECKTYSEKVKLVKGR